MPLHEQDIEKASFLFDVNIKGVFYCMKYEIEQMLKTGGGAIVNTSSIFGLNGYPGWSLYVATKHAVTGMTKAAALDYAKKNIRVNAVGPGPVETPLLAKGTGGDPHSYAAFVPMGRIGQPDEIADAVVWLLSERGPLCHRPHPARGWWRLLAVKETIARIVGSSRRMGPTQAGLAPAHTSGPTASPAMRRSTI